jgi:hypothetical protein
LFDLVEYFNKFDVRYVPFNYLLTKTIKMRKNDKVVTQNVWRKSWLGTLLFSAMLLFGQIGYGQCTNTPSGAYSPLVPTCGSGPISNQTNCWTGEYSEVTVVAGETYEYSSSDPTHYITIMENDGVTVLAHGTTPVTHTAGISGIYRFATHLSVACDFENTNHTRTAECLPPPPVGCTNTPSGAYSPLVPTCGSGPISNQTNCWTGEYSEVTVVAGETYEYSSSDPTHYITIMENDGVTVLASGTTPVTHTAAISGIYRFATHLSAACDFENTNHTRTAECLVAPADGLSCAGAVDVSAGGTFSTGAITGALENFCAAPSGPTASNWFVYTAASDGDLTVSSCGGPTDSYLAIGAGICGSIASVDCTDDDCLANETSTIAMLSGESVYITWTDSWTGSAVGHDFSVTFDGASPCDGAEVIAACEDVVSTTIAAGTGDLVGYEDCSGLGFPLVGGEAYYSFVPAVTGDYTLEALSVTTSPGFFLDFLYREASCAAAQADWNCLLDVNGAATSAPFTMTAGTTYYFLIKAEDTAGASATWTLNCPDLGPTCDYTVRIGDIFGDGWDGSVWEVRQDGTPIATIGGATGCTISEFPISVAEGAEISLWWVTAGGFTGEKAVQLLDFEDNVVYEFRGTSTSTNCPGVNWGTATAAPVTFPTQMFSGTSACTPPVECFSSIQFGTNTAPEPGDGTVTFTTCIFAEEYRVVNGLTSAVEYEFVSFNDITLDPAFLTIKTDADVFIQSGFSPQVVTGYTGNLHVLVNTDDACGTLQDCFALACTATLPPVCVPTWATGTFNGCQDGDVVARVLVNTLDNESGAGCPSGALGYSDYTDYSLNPEWTTELQAGTSYDVEVFAGQWGENVAVWIDYNDDNVFDNPGERVGFTTSPAPGSGIAGVTSSTSAVFSISLACDPPVGEHLMRVRAVFSGTVPGSGIEPCTQHGQWGETEDYLITILAPPACPSPSALVASNATTGSVDLDWNIGCTETAWEVEYGAPGFTPGDGTTVPAGTNVAFLLDGLDDETTYDVYVRADCDVDGLSPEFGPVSFTTLAFPPANDDCDDAEAVANNSSTPFTLVNTVAGADITSCVFNDVHDAWYSFDVPSAGTLSVDTEGTVGLDTGLSLWDACGGTELACDDDGGTGTLSLITYVTSGASTIYIRVAGYNGNVGTGLVNVNFVPFPVNNDCDDATAINPVSPNVAYGMGFPAQANAIGTLWGSTASGTGSCGAGTDVFYSLNVPFENHYTITVNPFGGADVAWELFDVCGGTSLACADAAGAAEVETDYLISLAAGDYIIRVSGAATSSAEGQFLLNVQAAPTSKVMFGTGCNETGLQIEDVIRCNKITGALDYEWRFVEVGGGLDASVIRSSVGNAGSTNNRNLRLSWVPGIDYNKLYNVFVRGQFDIPGYGVVWGAYRIFGDVTVEGSSDCTVETGTSVSATQLRPEYSPNNPISGQPHTFCNNLVAEWVGQAELFEWELDGPTFHEVQTPNYHLNIGSVAGIQAGQIYNVRVRARVNGLWGSYGVQLPAAVGLPSNTQLIAAHCGSTRALNQAVAAINVCGASSYTFRFQHGSEAERVVVRPAYTCPLWQVQPPLTPGETYSVSVKVTQGGVDGDYSTPCDVTIAGPVAEGLADDMLVSKVVAEGALGIYPNPNAGSEVRVELDGIEDGAHNVEVTIYDIYGKLMTRDVFGHQGSQLSRLVRFDNELATGMYLVHVTIDGNIFATEKLIVK